MKLKELLKDVNYKLIQGKIDLDIKDLTYDSRTANKSKAFVAMKGFRVDGHDYIDKAIDNGCKCIILEELKELPKDITIIKLDDTRTDLSKISRTLFNYPDKSMTTIAITGTKGKTTTSSIIKRILDDNNISCGLIGTMGVFYKNKYYHTMNTSPESYDVFKYMREMLDNGVKHLVMEVSSQSLKLKRWSNLIFDYAVFTNLSLDHVGDDEHESFDDYKFCKSLLFKQCKTGLFNIDDEYAKYMMKDTTCKTYTFGKSNKADYKIDNCINIIDSNFIGIELTTKGIIEDTFKVSIPGLFTAYNAISAIAICNLLKINTNSIKEILKSVSVKGRLEPVKVSKDFKVLIDYAYQGIAMENVLKTIKESKPKRIVTVFGCGGNRSRQRRFDCGEVSGTYADLSILTADNPRFEDNNKIIEDILIGMNKTKGEYTIIPDRREAIKYSITNAKPGDVILILGKGHEDYQEIEGIRHPFDERVVIKEIIDSLSKEEKERLKIINK
ncbi:MAG: UDP-N-acetylmuramoyl-L-alanyl-D-glutamate--2,6-diaminopimelate ligase [Bacilli bacterium]|nr:UDP-N-acetylmuramoyl-L-alanyl-D-glutamate--2,6-diaminopimelate ligase [Bacilli bacterium]